MNLFCFSLEGSTDNLYWPVEHSNGSQDSAILPIMPSSPRALLKRSKWQGSDSCIASLGVQVQKRTSSLKKGKRKSHIAGAGSLESEAVDIVHWQAFRHKEDSAQVKNSQNDVMDKDLLQARLLPEDVRQLSLERRERGQTTQTVNFEAWNPNWDPSERRQQDVASEAEGEAPEVRGTLRKIQKLVRIKRGSQTSTEEGRAQPDTSDKGLTTDAVFKEDSPVITCIGLGKKPEQTPGRQLTQRQQSKGGSSGSDTDPDKETEIPWSPTPHPQHQWGCPDVSPLPWDTAHHTSYHPRAALHLCTLDFRLPCDAHWERYGSLIPELGHAWGNGSGNGNGCRHEQVPPQQAIHSIAPLEMTDTTRSSSFGKFDTFKFPRQAKLEENGDTVPSTEAAETAEADPARQGTIGKKMKAISMTMRKRMGKKYIKALSEEMGEDTERDHETEGDTDASNTVAKACRRSSNSLESLYSGQSSSSGITSGSEGSSNRDSLRLEEEVPYTGQFCGKARVHTDFVPSPYDTESLRLKVGDVIDIISKPPMGIWTGMLHNRVGSFKFIYVDVLAEEEPVSRRRVGSQGRSKRPRPSTLLELLTCLDLEEHASSLMLNGYQTVEDLKELREQHLIELNMTDPEHRHRLLAATECLHEPDHTPKDGEVDEAAMSPSETQKAELKDCPRDSGCYIPSDVSDGSKDDTVNLTVLNSSPAEGSDNA